MALTSVTDVTYTTTLDSLSVKMDVTYPDQADSPILIVMHGYDGYKTGFATYIKERMANYGVFVACVDMRGRDTSGGSADDGAKEIYDIYDAAEYIKDNYSSYVDSSNINIVGYSGGGGNVLSCATKFPDYFGVLVDFFGISDYGYDLTYGYYQQAIEERRTELETRIGGSPTGVPDNYRARDSVAAVKNNTGSRIRIYHDEDDGGVLIHNTTRWTDEVTAQGLSNTIANISTSDDSLRWSHGYPTTGTDLIDTESTWMSEINSGTYSNWTIENIGDINVCGYIKTKRFEIFIGDGDSDFVPVTYDLSGRKKTFNFDNTDTGNASSTSLEVYDLESSTEYNVSHKNITDSTTISTQKITSDSDGLLNVDVTLVADKETQVIISDCMIFSSINSLSNIVSFSN